jgi:hypothetical protein
MDGLSNDPAVNYCSLPKRALRILPFHYNLGENWIACFDPPRIDGAHQLNLQCNVLRAAGMAKGREENEWQPQLKSEP